MTFPELSPSSFHDAANQGLTPENESRTTPASAGEGTPANENTPIGQRRLFTQPNSRQSDDVEDVDDEHNKNLRQIYNQSQELDMELVNEEANKDSDGDSNCSTANCQSGQVFASALESASEQLEVLVLEDDADIICNTPQNMIEIKTGLDPEVKLSEPPADWVLERIKVEFAEPESFIEVDNPGGWGQYTFHPKFHRQAKGKDIKKGHYSHHALPTGARPVPAGANGKREKAGWEFHCTRVGRMLKNPLLEAGQCTRIIPFLNPERVICGHGGYGKEGRLWHSCQKNE
jgi:hypothetical protein